MTYFLGFLSLADFQSEDKLRRACKLQEIIWWMFQVKSREMKWVVVLSDEGCEMRILHEIFMGQVVSSNGVGLMGGAGYVGRVMSSFEYELECSVPLLKWVCYGLGFEDSLTNRTRLPPQISTRRFANKLAFTWIRPNPTPWHQVWTFNKPNGAGHMLNLRSETLIGLDSSPFLAIKPLLTTSPRIVLIARSQLQVLWGLLLTRILSLDHGNGPFSALHRESESNTIGFKLNLLIGFKLGHWTRPKSICTPTFVRAYLAIFFRRRNLSTIGRFHCPAIYTRIPPFHIWLNKKIFWKKEPIISYLVER